MKRKAAKKLREKQAEQEKISAAKSASKPESVSMPVPALMMKILAVILSVIMIIALTLFVLNKMPARGFFFLTMLLAIVAFVVLPAMRKRFGT